jgi:hypothetical protein
MRALEVYGLSAKHWKHPDLAPAREHPAENFSALVCNLNQHWWVYLHHYNFIIEWQCNQVSTFFSCNCVSATVMYQQY